MKPDPYKQKASRKHQSKNFIKPKAPEVKEKTATSVSDTKDLKGTSSISIKYEKKRLPSNNFRFQELNASLQDVQPDEHTNDEEKELLMQTNHLKELVDRADESNFDPQTYFQFQSEQLNPDSDTFWIGASTELNQKNLNVSSTEDESDDQGDLAFREVFSLDFGTLADDLYTLEEEERLNINREDIEKLMTGFSHLGSFQTRVTIPTYKPWKTLSPEPDNQVNAKAAIESTNMQHETSHKQLDEDEKDLDDLLAMDTVDADSQNFTASKILPLLPHSSSELYDISLRSGSETSKLAIFPKEVQKEDDMEAWLDDMLG